jgi:hypothetical protein
MERVCNKTEILPEEGWDFRERCLPLGHMSIGRKSTNKIPP